MSEIIKSPPVRHASSESVSSTPSKSSAMSLSSDSSSLTEHEKTDISRVATSKQSPQPTNNLELPSKEELDELSESMDVRSYRKLKSATLNFKYLRRLGKENPEEIKEKLGNFYRSDQLYSTATDTNTPYHKSFSRTIEIPPSFVQEYGNVPGKRSSLDDTRSRSSSVSSSEDNRVQQLVDQLGDKVKQFLIDNNCTSLLDSVTLNVKPKDKRNEEHVINVFQSNQDEWQIKSQIKKPEQRRSPFRRAADMWDTPRVPFDGFDDVLAFDNKQSLEDRSHRERSKSTNESLSETAMSPPPSRSLDTSDNILHHKDVLSTFTHIRKEGFLMIRKKHMSKKVLCVLTDSQIHFFNIKTDLKLTWRKVPKELLAFSAKSNTVDLLHTSIKALGKKEFEIITLKKKILCAVESEDDVAAWLSAIQTVCQDLMLNTLGQRTTEMGNEEILPDQNDTEEQKMMKELLKVPGNEICADCNAKSPDWISARGVVAMVDSVYRSLGVHISKVRSVTLDNLEPEHVEVVKTFGNAKINAIYEANLGRVEGYSKISPTCDTETRRRFLVAKYDKKLFADLALLEKEQKMFELRELKNSLLFICEFDELFRSKMKELLSPSMVSSQQVPTQEASPSKSSPPSSSAQASSPQVPARPPPRTRNNANVGGKSQSMRLSSNSLKDGIKSSPDNSTETSAVTSPDISPSTSSTSLELDSKNDGTIMSNTKGFKELLALYSEGEKKEKDFKRLPPKNMT